MTLLAIALLALTRAEIVQRMRAPVITQADGMVRVYASCAEDVRREYQHPVASFAAETVKTLYGGLSVPRRRFASPAIIIHIGDVRTNDTTVAAKVATNGAEVVTRIYLRNPATSDIMTLRTEIVKAFVRSLKGREISDELAERAYRRADPAARVADSREDLERWLAGKPGPDGKRLDDEEMIKAMRKVFEPGRASRRDVLTFASRLFLYPRTYDEKFMGVYDCLSFRDAVKVSRIDPRVRFLALFKADEMPVFGGGRGEKMSEAAELYSTFLRELAKGELDDDGLYDMLDKADAALSAALEGAAGGR